MGLKGRIKFVCVAMCSLVMCLCSRDLHVTLIITIHLIAVDQPTQHLVLDGTTSICFIY